MAKKSVKTKSAGQSQQYRDCESVQQEESLALENILTLSLPGPVPLEVLKPLIVSNPNLHARHVGRLACLEAAHFIKAARKNAEMSQKDLAEKLGCNQSYLSQVENPQGDHSVSLSFLAKVAQFCGGSIRIEFESDKSKHHGQNVFPISVNSNISK